MDFLSKLRQGIAFVQAVVNGKLIGRAVGD
jgi:hypothetical protein